MSMENVPNFKRKDCPHPRKSLSVNSASFPFPALLANSSGSFRLPPKPNTRMHASKSETVGQLLPEGVERQVRAQLRALRFGQPQEYAQLQQVAVRKFLSSKSVHSWLSEWELSHAFGANASLNRRGSCRRALTPHNCWASTCSGSFKADAAVQCVPEEIDEELGLNSRAAALAALFSSPDAHLNRTNPEEFWRGRRSFAGQEWQQPFPPMMDVSTNTQTTETTGTGGMNVYRRASYLEEYAMERVREMEQEREAKEAKERQKEAERKKRRRADLWRKCFCCCCWRRRRSSSEDRTSSTSFGNSNSTKKPSSANTQGTFDDQKSGSMGRRKGSGGSRDQQQLGGGILVKKFTLSRSGRPGAAEQDWRHRTEALRFNAPMPGCAYNHGVITGNYDNTTPPPGMQGQHFWSGRGQQEAWSGLRRWENGAAAGTVDTHHFYHQIV